MKILSKSVLIVVIMFITRILLAQDKVLSPEKIQHLVPNRIKGFSHDPEVKAKLIKVGDLQYSLCEHRYTKGKQSIRVLLFDFKDAQMATKEWKNYSPVISDSLTFRSVLLTNCTGWESYYKNSSTSQIPRAGAATKFFIVEAIVNPPRSFR